ncbi:hypothetical protein F53441_10009 [Fusarium austroafricanum]|uniref:Uncharacterized protein n=1 Tax=Fusarium austroafricanum TaxID=2364996 RepID=A0A8H4KBN6_9HYPO|nr:hypothetical protein F53441_10009 [Fusarium austroafricanum]
MENKTICAWISDQHILLHNCTNPFTCQLPLYTNDDQMDDQSNLRRSPRKHSGSSQCSSQSSDSNDPQRPRSDAIDDVFAPEELDKTPRPRANLPFRPLDSNPDVDDNDNDNADDTDLVQQREYSIPILPPPTNLSMSFTAKLSASRPSLASRSRTGSTRTTGSSITS